MPVALATLSLWPLAEALHAWLHVAFAAVVLPTTLLALRTGRRRARRGAVTASLLLGLGLVLAGPAAGAGSEGAETALTLLGSGLLLHGHWGNLHRSQGCAQGHTGGVPLRATRNP
jgi:hypothetical protein